MLRAVSVAAALCIPAVIAPPIAGAQPGGAEYFRYTSLDSAQTFADGLCGGPLSGAATAARDKPGELYIYVRGSFFGISSQPGVPCFVHATLTWRNLATGQSGAVTGPVGRAWGSPPFSPDPVGQEIAGMWQTGSGPVELTLFSDHLHIPATTLVEVY